MRRKMSPNKSRSARRQIADGRNMTLAQHQRFERPHRPERNDHREGVVLANHALFVLQLQLQIIAKQA